MQKPLNQEIDYRALGYFFEAITEKNAVKSGRKEATKPGQEAAPMPDFAKLFLESPKS